MRVEPDIAFVEEVSLFGGSNAKTCQQCATCSVTCPLSPDNNPYPRKEMIWAAWGMRDQLMGDPDIWLCHQCGDCADACTRDSHPRDILSGLRARAIQHFAVPGFMGKLVAEPRYLPVLLTISVVFVALMIVVQQLWVGGPLVFGEAHFEYEQFLAHRVLNTMFPLAFFTMVGCAIAGAVRFWRAMDRVAGDWGTEPGQAMIPSAIGAVTDLIRHNRFDRCDAGHTRRSVHLIAFYGFMGLFVVTGIATILTVLEHLPSHPELYPMGWLHPVKIMGNAAGVALVGGVVYAYWFRRADPEAAGVTTYGDHFFLILLLTVGLTGFGAEFVRLTPLPASLGTPVYVVHLLSVFWLLIFFPYSKFAHALYRYLAMVHARHTGRPLPAVREATSP